MALQLSHLKCHSCEKPFIFRIGVGQADEQKFVFQCPECSAVLRGTLRVDYKKAKTRLESEDFIEIPPKKARHKKLLCAVTIYTDLPVHISCRGKSLAEGGSAFLFLRSVMSGQQFTTFMTKVHSLQEFRLTLFPLIRRASSLYVNENFDTLKRLLASAVAPQFPDGTPPEYMFNRLLDSLFLPLLDLKDSIPLKDEFFAHLNVCNAGSRPQYHALLKDMFDASGFRQFKRQLIETVAKCFSKFDALVPGLALEHFSPKFQSRIDEFTLFRDDFDELKSLYVDIFELSSRALAYIGSIVNLSIRGNSQQWADGRNHSLKAVLKLKAFEREFILDELPLAKQLYNGINRHTRNDFGHCKVFYHFETGCLIDEQGRAENYLLFLKDFLGAVRVMGYLVALVEKVGLDYHDIDTTTDQIVAIPAEPVQTKISPLGMEPKIPRS